MSTHLIGREADLLILADLRRTAGTGREAVLRLVGEAGIGKSSVLTAASAEATRDGWQVLGFQGALAEARIGYGGLLGILRPLQPHIPDIPEPQGRALLGVMGAGERVSADDSRGEAGSAERFLVGAAVLSLLAEAARAAPILVAVDDAQWVDPETLAALAFAARRLTRDPVAVVVAGRSDAAAGGALTGLPVHRLAGLSQDDAAALLGPSVAPSVAASLTHRTGGNPLALLECRRALSPAQRAGAAPLPQGLPVGEQLTEAFARQAAALPPDSQAALLLLAAGGGPAGAVAEALDRMGIDSRTALAASDGFLAWERGALRWRHPLMQAAVWQHASADDRRTALRALAEALPNGPARTWALAGAAEGYDDDSARQLAALAEQERTRGGFAAAAAAGERSAQLTRDRTRADLLLAQAAADALLAGDTAGVGRLAQQVLAGNGSGEPAARARALAALGSAAQFHGSHRRACDLLLQSADLASGRLLLTDLVEAAHLSYILDDVAAIHRCAERAGHAADPADAVQRMLTRYLSGMSATLAGDPVGGAELMHQVVALFDGEPELVDDPQFLLVALLSGRWALDPGLAQPTVERLLARARARGALGVLAPALSLIASGYAIVGDNRRAYALAGEAVDLLDILGFTTEPGIAHEMLAMQCAARGAADRAQQLMQRAVAASEAAGLDPRAPHLVRAQAFCDLCAGRWAEVVVVLEDLISRHGGPGPFLEPLGVAPDLVAAYLALGRGADAADLVRRFAAANPHPPPHIAALIERCRGQVAGDAAESAAAYERALAIHADAPVPLEVGRTRLAYGMRLRRDGQRVAARQQLQAARTLFQRDDLAAWVARCDTELRATGEHRGSGDAGAALTAQETQVALMVAQGMSNRDIAAALFLSPRTVEHHVGAALRKRGLASRTQLAAAMLAGNAASGPGGVSVRDSDPGQHSDEDHRDVHPGRDDGKDRAARADPGGGAG